MIEWIQGIYQDFAQFSNQNQVVAGAVSLWGLTVFSYLARGIPMSIWRFIKRNFTTSMTLNNTGWEKEIMMTDFLKWFEDNKFTSWSRTFMVVPSQHYLHSDDEDAKKNVLSAGYGIHFFFYKGGFFWMNIDKLDSSGSERQKEEVTIYKMGRSNKKFEELVSDFTPERKSTKFIHEWSTDGWRETKPIIKKPISSVAMNPKIENFVENKITEFHEMKEWYYERGLPYKMTTILYGCAGTGKTSLLRAIATEFDKHICSININEMHDGGFSRALGTAPKDSIVIIEDFDSSSAVKSREVVKSGGSNGEFSILSLSGILNALDGVATLDNVMIFLTTNHLDHVDSALYRKGRVDEILEVEALQPNTAQKHSEKIFDGYDFSGVFTDEIVGCHLHSALLESKDNPEVYKETIREVYDTNRNLHSS